MGTCQTVRRRYVLSKKLGTWILGVCLWVMTSAAEPVALVVGIGTTRAPRDPEPAPGGSVVQPSSWRMLACPAARQTAEQAFRELTPSAQGAASLYGRSPVWEEINAPYRVSVLLTDGAVNNRYVPSTRVLSVQARWLRGRTDDRDEVIVFIAGMGEAQGLDSWVYDRLGEPFPVRRLVDAWGEPDPVGRRIFLVRIHAPGCGDVPTSLWISDPVSLGRFRDWADQAVESARRRRPVDPPGERLPGWSHEVAAATPPRLLRLSACVSQSRSAANERWLVDLTDGLERRNQSIEVRVRRRVEPVYRVETIRRPGPLFTIIEEDLKTRIGSRTVVERPPLEDALRSSSLWPSVVTAVADAVERNSETGFDTVVKSGGVDYDASFDGATGLLRIQYLD